MASFDFLSPKIGWILGVRCGSCSVSLLGTVDGGHSWSTLPVPAEALASDDGPGPGVRSVVFADQANGWLVGHDLADTWVTHDAGAHWAHPLLAGLSSVGVEIDDLEVAGGQVYAVSYPYDTEGDYQIQRSPVDRETWHRSPTTISFGAGPVPVADILLQGTSGWIIENDRVATAGVRLSSGTWLPWQPPCLDPQGSATLSASSAYSLAVLCDGSITTQTLFTAFSTDGGRSFHPGAVPVPLSATSTVASVVSTADTTMFVEGNSDQGRPELVATFDAGTRWLPTFQGKAGGQWGGLDFMGPETGWASLAYPDAAGGGLTGGLLATSDGGHTWAAVYDGAAGELMHLNFFTRQIGVAILSLSQSSQGEIPTGELVMSLDGGHTWRAAQP